MTAMVKTLLTSYRLIPAGTNSGALAESLDVLTIESTSLPLRGPGVPLPLAFCRGLLCLFESKRGRGHTLLVPYGWKWFPPVNNRYGALPLNFCCLWSIILGFEKSSASATNDKLWQKSWRVNKWVHTPDIYEIHTITVEQVHCIWGFI